MKCSILAWSVEADLAATRQAYERIAAGASRRCGCPSCRNFDVVRPDHYPEAFCDILDAVGVDACKERAVRLVAPLEGGLHLYAGTYLFCGTLLTGRPYRGFPFACEEVDVFEKVAEGTHVALRPWDRPEDPWLGWPCTRCEFLVILPWVLGEAQPTLVDLSRQNERLTS